MPASRCGERILGHADEDLSDIVGGDADRFGSQLLAARLQLLPDRNRPVRIGAM
jgi:hypothetical protein